jgi:hypothetical protein
MGTFGHIPYNTDINNPGASAFPRFSVYTPVPYQEAIVEDVILNSTHPDYGDGRNVGKIRVRIIPDSQNVPFAELDTAMPLDSKITEYPLIQEKVMVVRYGPQLYYLRTVNTSNKITENSHPGLSNRLSPQPSSVQRSDAAQIAAAGGQPYQPARIVEEKPLGQEFSENQTVRRVQSHEGDLTLQGRFGNIIRFGSSLFSNPTAEYAQPNLLLTVGQRPNAPIAPNTTNNMYSLVYEDINDDASTIWMVTDEEVTFGAATAKSQSSNKAHLRSSNIEDRKYTGAQIFVNSDRVVLNSKVNEISLFSNTEINLSALQSITIDSENSVYLSSNMDISLDAIDDVTVFGKTITLSSNGGDFSNKSSGNYSILGKKIFIGTSNDVSEPMVLGSSLSLFLQRLIDVFTTQLPLSVVTTPTGPGVISFLPLIGALRALQATQLGVTPQMAVFNSSDNFVTKNNSV